jgi:hypothetical protein
MKKRLLVLGMLVFSLGLRADVVTLTDGSSLKGPVTRLDNGDLKVSTGAGDITVPKDKIASVVSDGPAPSPAATESPYVKDVEARRQKYGNDDGLPHSMLINGMQLAFNVGEIFYTGDAFDSSALVKGGLNKVLNTSDLNGLNFGGSLVDNFTDTVGWELWAGYSLANKDFAMPGATVNSSVAVDRLDLGLSPRIQMLIPLGGQDNFLMPHLSVGPVVTLVNVSSNIVGGTLSAPLSGSGTGLGAAFDAGVDLDLGAALISAKLRYVVSYDTGSSFNSTNLSAFIPSIGLGWVF